MIGLHVIGDDVPELAALVAHQPPASILYLNPKDDLPYQAPITIGRLHYEPSAQEEMLANPVEAGRQVARDCIARAERCGIQIWQGLNEICVDNRAWADRYNAFERARVEVLEEAGLLAGVYSWSVGWPMEDLSRGNLFPEWYAPLMDWLDHSHYVIWHQYWGPEGPLHPASYDPLRPSKVDRQRYWPWPHRILITECGIDLTGKPDNGWKARVPPGMNLEEWADAYDDQLMEFDALVSQDERVVGKTVFMFGQGEWSDKFGIETHWPHFKCLVTDPAGPPAQPGLPPGPTIRVRLADGRVVVLPVEEYLRGVVPAEVFPSWPMETLQGQAVLARSVAMSRIHDPRDQAYDINRFDQAYDPAKFNDRTDVAIASTAGVYLMQSGEPWYAFYVSDCGLGRCKSCQGPPGFIPPNGTNPSGVWPGRACQWGLKALADCGYGWRDISMWYYPDQGVYLSDGGE